MDTANVIRQVLGEYERQRDANYREEQRRRREVCEAAPKILELMNERAGAFHAAQRAAFSGTPIRADELAGRIHAVNARIRTALLEAGFAEDYLQPVYRCPACRDTGYVGEPVHEQCGCLKQRVMDMENAGERKGGLGSHSFEQFDLTVYPDEPVPGERRSQREHMRLIERAARRYAEDFPDNEKQNLIFFGPPGLGKTFVADCIASRVMERAYLVRRITAYRLCEIMRRNQFDGSEANAVSGVLACDLLFIDDLGTEPRTKNTSGYLFQIINERNNNDQHTIISTNLTPEGLADAYEDRVASRMMDVSRTTAIRFFGRDLRLRRK